MAVRPLLDLVELRLWTDIVSTLVLRILPVENAFCKVPSILAEEWSVTALSDPIGYIRGTFLAGLSSLRLLVSWLLRG